MKPSMQTVVSCVYIYLLMSVHPIDAARINKQTKRTATVVDQSQEVVKELQKALQEDTQHAGQEYIGESWASCDQRKEDFERRTVKAKARYTEATKDGVVDTFEAAYVLLKMRSLAKTLSAAKNDKCKWVEEQSADMSVMKELVSKTAGKSRCFEKSKAYMERVRTKSQADQSKAFGKALQIFLSGDKYCKPIEVKVADTAAEEKDEAAEEVETDEAAEELTQEAADAQPTATAAADDAAEEETTEEATKVPSNATAEPALEASALLQAHAPLLFMPDIMSDPLLQTGAVAGVPVHPILALVIGVILFLLFIALSCVLILAVLGFILGLIFCMFKMVFVALIRIFGGKGWNYEFSGCLGFWLQGMTHPSPVAHCVIAVFSTIASAAGNDNDRENHQGHRRNNDWNQHDDRRRWSPAWRQGNRDNHRGQRRNNGWNQPQPRNNDRRRWSPARHGKGAHGKGGKGGGWW